MRHNRLEGSATISSAPFFISCPAGRDRACATSARTRQNSSQPLDNARDLRIMTRENHCVKYTSLQRVPPRAGAFPSRRFERNEVGNNTPRAMNVSAGLDVKTPLQLVRSLIRRAEPATFCPKIRFGSERSVRNTSRRFIKNPLTNSFRFTASAGVCVLRLPSGRRRGGFCVSCRRNSYVTPSGVFPA